MNRYDRYPGDYVRDTLDLSLAEDGAYTRLLDWYYANERAVPDDRKFAVTRATSVDDQKITQWVLSRFFILRNGEWHHERVDGEIKKARARIETARLNGQRGGRPRQIPVNPSGQETQPKPKPKPGTEPKPNPEQNLPSPSPPVNRSDPTDPRRVSLDADVKRVFESWRQDTGKFRAKLDDKRRRRIAARLRDGFTADELTLAITHRRNDPWLMGEDPRSTRVFDDIDTLLRDRAQVERLIALVTRHTPPNGHRGASAPKQPSSGYRSERTTRL